MEPGLFPEEPSESRRSRVTATLLLVALSFLLLLAYAGLQIRRLALERDRERARADELLALLKKSAPPASFRPTAPPEAPAPAPDVAAPTLPSPAPPDSPATDLRAVPPAPREGLDERLRQGLAELRAARYPQAELHFFRALPEGYVYLLLSSLGRGDCREAASFLTRAAAADPAWFRKASPRDHLSAAEYDRVLAALSARVRDNPLDAEAKLLLAYFQFHEKGPAYAKALLVEVTGLQPDHADARKFLRALDE